MCGRGVVFQLEIVQEKTKALNGVTCPKALTMDLHLTPDISAISTFSGNVILTRQSGIF